MERSSNQVWATRTGICPGTPFADLFFQGIFADSLVEIEQLVNQSELRVEAPGFDVSTWLDDLAVLLRSPVASELILRLEA